MTMLTIFLAICIFFGIFCLASGTLLLATDVQAQQRRRLRKRLQHLKGLGVFNPNESVLKSAAGRIYLLLLARSRNWKNWNCPCCRRTSIAAWKFFWRRSSSQEPYFSFWAW